MTNNSIRIRTTPGDSKNIRFKLDQDFDFLEILSLKITQEDLYQPFCADYGVVVGRVIANKGFGIPNAKVSVFIPITDDDQKNLLIKNLYPYKTPYQKNSDGVRYNLLLSKQTCSLNSPIGTFPSKEDVLDNETMLEVFDKYYKFTTKTNDSGDFMIFGVPVGQHTIHMDVDISDIGATSVRPYDLIAEGFPEKLFQSKTKFKTSTNLDSLPQIKTGNKGVEVIPFWGDAETCEIGITRVDFDTNLQLTSTALFFGSIFTDSAKMSLNLGCNPKNDQGEQDNFRTGSGLIKMIRAKEYLISDWVNSNQITPIELEEFDIEGGELINEDGVFAYPLPMNVGHVITDEFGNLIPSNSPEVGIATKGFYRFKMNFIEPNDNPKFRTGHMLFPSLGRDFGGSLGAVNGQTQGGTEDQRFSTNISDYGDINKDFHLFEFKQLYTIANFIKKYKKGVNRFSFLGIKNTDASSETTPFPYTNAVWKFDILYYLISFFIEFVAILLKFLTLLISICFGFCFNVVVKKPKLCVPLPSGDICIPGFDDENAILFQFGQCVSICPFNWLADILPQLPSGGRGFALPCETLPNGQIEVDLQNCSSGGYCGQQSLPVKVSSNPGGNCSSNSTSFNAGIVPNPPNSSQCVRDIEDWVCCSKVSLAESRNVIRRVFFDAWVLGTAYLFQFRYKRKIDKNGNTKKEKFCGPGSDTLRGDNYKNNKCCIDTDGRGECDRCLVRGPNTTKSRGPNFYVGVSNYHENWHNNAVTGANDIDDIIYCNSLMSTKIVSLGRIEMCEETLQQIENSIQASQALTNYVQNGLFYTGTFYENGWDLGYWVNYLKETSYEDPREVIDYLVKLRKCNIDPMFYGSIGCHEQELKDFEFFFMKEVSKIYNDVVTTTTGTIPNETDVFEPAGGQSNPYANLPVIDTNGGSAGDSGFEVDLEVANRFSPCGSNGNCNPGGNWSSNWSSPNDDSANNPSGFDSITNPQNRNNKNTRSNIPYYYFGINPGKTAINKLRKDFFSNV